MAKAEGENFHFEDTSKIDPNYLEIFDFDSPNQYIKTKTNEFSAVCPFSGLPDIAKVKIEYFPTGGKCVELKSLKYYSKGHHFVLFFIPWLKYALTVGCLQYSDFSLAVEGGIFNRGP